MAKLSGTLTCGTGVTLHVTARPRGYTAADIKESERSLMNNDVRNVRLDDNDESSQVQMITKLNTLNIRYIENCINIVKRIFTPAVQNGLPRFCGNKSGLHSNLMP